MSTGGLTWPLIEEARERIAGKVNVTPVLTSRTVRRAAEPGISPARRRESACRRWRHEHWG